LLRRANFEGDHCFQVTEAVAVTYGAEVAPDRFAFVMPDDVSEERTKGPSASNTQSGIWTGGACDRVDRQPGAETRRGLWPYVMAHGTVRIRKVDARLSDKGSPDGVGSGCSRCG